MGFLDDAKRKVSKLVDGREEQIKDGIDKAADVVGKKVGKEKQVDQAAEKAKDVVDDLGK